MRTGVTRWALLLAVVTALLLPAAAGAGPTHWAAGEAEAARQVGLLSSEELPRLDLDGPVDPGLWNRLAARALGLPEGAGAGATGTLQAWTWTYTGQMAGHDRLERGRAFSGLAKLLNVAGHLSLQGVDPGARERASQFKDFAGYDPGHAYLAATLIPLGLVGGYPDHTLRLEQPLTVGEALALAGRLHRAYPRPLMLPDPSMARSVADQATGGGVRVRLQAGSYAVQAGGTVTLTVEAANVGMEPVRYRKATPGAPVVRIVAATPDGEVPLRAPGEPEFDMQVIAHGELKPGEATGYSLEWQAPTQPGWYSLRAVFAGESEKEPLLQAIVTVQVR